MASEKKQRRKMGRELQEARAKHDRLMKRVKKVRAKMEKRTQKLTALEARIAQLEAKYHTPEEGRLGQADADGDIRRARLIFNPGSGGAQNGAHSLEQIVAALRAHGIVADIGIKTSGKAARELAKEAAANGEELVIVAAGDGTIEDVASMLIGTKTALGIIPTGTMNNLARALGVPLDLDAACGLLGMGVTRPVDLGHVLAGQKPDVEYFLETAGVGLSAILIPAGQAAEKHRWEELPDAIRKLFEAKPGRVTVQLDHGEKVQANAQVVTVSNAPLMGSNVLIAPDAKMDDGLLDVAIYDEMSKTELLGYFVSIANAKRGDNPKVRFFRAKHVRIETEEPVEAHSDKDLVPTERVVDQDATGAEGASAAAAPAGANGKLPAKYVLEVEVVPGAVKMVVGKGIGLSLPVESVPAVPPLSGPQPSQNESDPAKK